MGSPRTSVTRTLLILRSHQGPATSGSSAIARSMSTNGTISSHDTSALLGTRDTVQCICETSNETCIIADPGWSRVQRADTHDVREGFTVAGRSGRVKRILPSTTLHAGGSYGYYHRVPDSYSCAGVR